MDFTIVDIVIFLLIAWFARRLFVPQNAVTDTAALEYVRERIDGMEFELEYINGIWYCWILEDKVYTFVGQSSDRVQIEDACKRRVHDMCLKGLTG